MRDALDAGRPVVALESTVIAHGLPRPTNLEVARACERAVREGNAVPATIALADGVIRIGADDALLDALARRDDVRKVSLRDIAPVLARRELGSTTVAATVVLAALADVRVLSTGGIGGVHPDAERSDDVSADLDAIARYPVCVVCAGAKNVLDLARTLERLETLGVPVLTVSSDFFPAFVVRSSGIRTPYRSDDIREIADIAALRFDQGGGLVVALPIAEELALAPAEARAALDEARLAADAARVRGPELTPFLLREVAAREARALRANAALLEANARFAAAIANALPARA